MNSVVISGRLTKDVDLRYSANGNMAIAYFTVAVDNKDKDKTTSFINCKAFGKTGETISKYFNRGSRIIVRGSWKTGNYKNKDGNTVYTNDCMVNEFDFLDTKAERQQNNSNNGILPNNDSNSNSNTDDGFMNFDGVEDEGLPFN